VREDAFGGPGDGKGVPKAYVVPASEADGRV